MMLLSRQTICRWTPRRRRATRSVGRRISAILFGVLLLAGCGVKPMAIYVQDLSSQEPVAGAFVQAKPLYVLRLFGPTPKGDSGRTDENGKVILDVSPAKSVRIEVYSNDHMRQSVNIGHPHKVGITPLRTAYTEAGEVGTLQIMVKPIP